VILINLALKSFMIIKYFPVENGYRKFIQFLKIADTMGIRFTDLLQLLKNSSAISDRCLP